MQLKVSDTRPTISVGKARDPGLSGRLYYKHELYYRHALYLGGKSFGAYPTVSVDDRKPVISSIGET